MNTFLMWLLIGLYVVPLIVNFIFILKHALKYKHAEINAQYLVWDICSLFLPVFNLLVCFLFIGFYIFYRIEKRA
jgi:hypothetical protein